MRSLAGKKLAERGRCSWSPFKWQGDDEGGEWEVCTDELGEMMSECQGSPAAPSVRRSQEKEEASGQHCAARKLFRGQQRETR